MDGISRSRGWDKDIPHGVLPMEQLVLSDKWARIRVSFIYWYGTRKFYPMTRITHRNKALPAAIHNDGFIFSCPFSDFFKNLQVFRQFCIKKSDFFLLVQSEKNKFSEFARYRNECKHS